MSWLRFGDDFIDDPAVMDLGDDEPIAGWTYVRLVSYAAKHLTDGRIPAGKLRHEDATGVAALIRVGLVDRRDDGDGFLPRFLEVRDSRDRVVGGHHPSRATVEDRRAKRAAAGQEGGHRSSEAKARAKAQATGEANAEATPKQVAEHHAKQNGHPVSRFPIPVDPWDSDRDSRQPPNPPAELGGSYDSTTGPSAAVVADRL